MIFLGVYGKFGTGLIQGGNPKNSARIPYPSRLWARQQRHCR